MPLARACGAWPGSAMNLRFARRWLAAVCLLSGFVLNGCAYGIFEDSRLIDTMAEDKTMATGIKSALLREHFTGGMAVSVYVFYGNVFLVGEVPKKMQARAIEVARKFRPASITPHWFSPARSDVGNLALATSLRADLIGTRGLSSTRIDTEVNAGRVVLLGVVHDNAEKQLAISVARKVRGVTSVTSYLLVPQRAAQK